MLPATCVKIMQIINQNDQRYLVKWKTDEINMSIENIQLIKEYRDCDIVLRGKDNMLYFCQTIQEIDFQEI